MRRVASISSVDNVEYIVVNNPAAGHVPVEGLERANGAGLPAARTAWPPRIIRGDPTPTMTASLTRARERVAGTTFEVTATVSTPSYVASGVQVELTDDHPSA